MPLGTRWKKLKAHCSSDSHAVETKLEEIYTRQANQVGETIAGDVGRVAMEAKVAHQRTIFFPRQDCPRLPTQESALRKAIRTSSSKPPGSRRVWYITRSYVGIRATTVYQRNSREQRTIEIPDGEHQRHGMGSTLFCLILLPIKSKFRKSTNLSSHVQSVRG